MYDVRGYKYFLYVRYVALIYLLLRDTAMRNILFSAEKLHHVLYYYHWIFRIEKKNVFVNSKQKTSSIETVHFKFLHHCLFYPCIFLIFYT